MQATDSFQGLCLVSSEGFLHMDEYDQLRPEVRKRLRESPYNLCAACVNDAAEKFPDNNSGELDYITAISSMEQQIRCEEI